MVLLSSNQRLSLGDRLGDWGEGQDGPHCSISPGTVWSSAGHEFSPGSSALQSSPCDPVTPPKNHTCVCVCTYKHTRACVCMRVYLCARECTCACVCMSVSTCMCVHTCVHCAKMPLLDIRHQLPPTGICSDRNCACFLRQPSEEGSWRGPWVACLPLSSNTKLLNPAAG